MDNVKKKSIKNFLEEDFHIIHRKNTSTAKVNKHHHNAYEIIIQNNGTGSFFIKDKNYNMKAQTLFLINEYDIHHYFFPEKLKTYDRFVLYIKSDFLNNYFNYIKDDFKPVDIFKKEIKCLKLNEPEYKQLKFLSERMILELTKEKTGYRSIVNSYLLQFFVTIHRLLENNKYNGLKEKGKNEGRLQKIIAYIDDNYKENITLNEIAETLYISKYYLSHFFKDKTGFTIIEFLNNKRIIEAQKMLKNTNLNVTDIAMNVGFNTLNHFERTFKNINGITPTQYRNINSNNF
ncbi:MAG: AraC family transcriptional regulator [Bacillota bacterium]